MKKNDIKDINEEYYRIFGRKEYPQLFSPDDEEYSALRREIISAPREPCSNSTPFKDIKVSTAEECRLEDSIQRMRKMKKRIFIIKEGRSPRIRAHAAAYYDRLNDRFIVLEGSYCILTPYTLKLLNDYEQRCKNNIGATPIDEKFQRINGYVYLLKDQTYKSADVAASFWTGKKTTFREWKDRIKNTLDDYYNRFQGIDSL